MLTPQEVSEHAFAKAGFGGYNMAMVDEFLDQLTVDYTALYKENASLKVKMKVLADSLEEYRSTEKGMRRALLAAQQAADEMVKEAEKRKAELIRAAEAEAQLKMTELRQQVADEQARLSAAQAATANYVEQVNAAIQKHQDLLTTLDGITAPKLTRIPDPVAQTAQIIEQSVQRLVEDEEEEEEPAREEENGEDASSGTAPVYLLGGEGEDDAQPLRSRRDQERARAFEEAPAEEDEEDEDDIPTRRIDFDNLQFGSNYDLK